LHTAQPYSLKLDDFGPIVTSNATRFIPELLRYTWIDKEQQLKKGIPLPDCVVDLAAPFGDYLNKLDCRQDHGQDPAGHV
jgi:hypothetical protein